MENFVAQFEGMYSKAVGRRHNVIGAWDLSVTLDIDGFTVRRYYNDEEMFKERGLHYAAMLEAVREQVGQINDAATTLAKEETK